MFGCAWARPMCIAGNNEKASDLSSTCYYRGLYNCEVGFGAYYTILRTRNPQNSTCKLTCLDGHLKPPKKPLEETQKPRFGP